MPSMLVSWALAPARFFHHVLPTPTGRALYFLCSVFPTLMGVFLLRTAQPNIAALAALTMTVGLQATVHVNGVFFSEGYLPPMEHSGRAEALVTLLVIATPAASVGFVLGTDTAGATVVGVMLLQLVVFSVVHRVANRVG